MHAKKNKMNPVFIIVTAIVMLVLGGAGILLGTKLVGMGILPTGLLLGYFLFLAAFEVLIFFTRKVPVVKFVVYVCSLVLSVALLFGYSALGKVDNTVRSITALPEIQTKTYSVITMNDSAIDGPSQLTGKRIGYMDMLDSVTVTRLQNKLAEQQATELTFVSAGGVVETVDALRNGEVDAVVLNPVYIDMIDEDVYEGFEDEVKEICAVELAEAVETVQWTQVTTETGGDSQATAVREELKTFVVYVSGIDTYGSVDVQSRSDVNILAVVNTEEHKVQLINTPRDYYVPLPISNGVRDKLTHAGIYGIDVSIGTLEMLYDIDVEYFVRVNFSGFKEIIDALGGIDVNSEYSFSAKGYSFSKGVNHLDGAAALVFARERHAFAAGDVQRGKNQMAVITAMIDKMLSTEMLRNYATILNSISGSFQTNFTADEIYSLVSSQLLSASEWSVDSYTVTGYDSSALTYSIPSAYAYVMKPDDDKVATAKSLIDELLGE